MRNLLLPVAASVGLAMCAACERKPEPREIRFVDISEGLPAEGQWRQHVVVADLDGDEQPEIIAPPARREEKPRPHIWSRNARGIWEERPERFPDWPYDYGGAAVADFDGDGRPDLAFACHGQGVVVLRNLGERNWELATEGLPPPGEFRTRGLAAGDLDGDGWPDLVAVAELTGARSEGPLGVRLFFNAKGEGWRSESIEVAGDAFGDRVVIADVTGDGSPEIILAALTKGYRHVVWKRQDDGWQPLSAGMPENLLYWGASVCERDDASGPMLLLAADSNRSDRVWGPRALRFAGGEWSDLSSGLPTEIVRDVAVGRFAESEPCTVAAASRRGGAIRLYRHAGAAWQPWQTLERPEGIGGPPYGVLVDDVDGDGHPDVVANYAAEPNLGGIRVWASRR